MESYIGGDSGEGASTLGLLRDHTKKRSPSTSVSSEKAVSYSNQGFRQSDKERSCKQLDEAHNRMRSLDLKILIEMLEATRARLDVE